MRRILRNLSGNIVQIELDGTIMSVQSGREGSKLRTSTKELISHDEALKALYKKEWESLKKGFVLYNETATFGQARLHKFIGGGYTGALSFVCADSGFLVYKNSVENEKFIDYLVRVGELGEDLGEIRLPKPLAWQAESIGEKVVLNLDHCIYELDPKSGECVDMKDRVGQCFGVQICARANRLVVASDQIYIFDESLRAPLEVKCKCDENTRLALSRDGSKLAVSVGDEIRLLDTTSGEWVRAFQSRVKKVGEIAFIGGELLAVVDYYSYNYMKFINTSSGEEAQPQWLFTNKFGVRDIDSICVNDDESRLVMIGNARAYVFDLVARKLVGEFRLEHVVKRCEAKFTSGGLLAVRTDYGCFSLYQI